MDKNKRNLYRKFLRHLKNNLAYTNYFWEMSHNNSKDSSFVWTYDKNKSRFFEFCPPYDWFDKSFIWQETTMGFEFWSKICEEWRAMLTEMKINRSTQFNK